MKLMVGHTKMFLYDLAEIDHSAILPLIHQKNHFLAVEVFAFFYLSKQLFVGQGLQLVERKHSMLSVFCDSKKILGGFEGFLKSQCTWLFVSATCQFFLLHRKCKVRRPLSRANDQAKNLLIQKLTLKICNKFSSKNIMDFAFCIPRWMVPHRPHESYGQQASWSSI